MRQAIFNKSLLDAIISNFIPLKVKLHNQLTSSTTIAIVHLTSRSVAMNNLQ